MNKKSLTLLILSIISTASFATDLTNNKSDVSAKQHVSNIDTSNEINQINQIENDKSTTIISKKITTEDIILKGKNEGILKVYKQSPEFFKTNERLKIDLDLENKMIEKFKKSFFDKRSEFDKNDYDLKMNKFFIDALKTGNRNLADAILYDSKAKIDVNFRSDSPKNTPLSAVATSFAYNGGDIEYAIKLIEMGADTNEVTLKNNIPLMSLAAIANNYKIVLYLAMIGKNPMYLDGLDYYPLDYASKNNAYETTIILTKIIDNYVKEINKNKK